MLSKLSKRVSGISLSSGVVLLARLLHNLNGFLLSIIVVRRFGLSAAGSLALAGTGTMILSTVCTFGLPYLFARLDLPIGVRNFIGLVAALAGMVVTVPVAAALSLVFCRSPQEAVVIFLLSLGGAFFAQTTISSSLLVLQGRAVDMILSPFSGLLGLVAGYLFARDILGFAVIIAVARLIGGFAAYGRLPIIRVPIGTAVGHIRGGLKYLAADSTNLISDQASVILASAFLSRADLGLLGLCRQIIAVSDTPAYSSLVMTYPDLCADPGAYFPGVLSRLVRLGVGCMVMLSIVTVPMALWVYHLPQLILPALLIVCSVPFRYSVGAYESLLQAMGAFRAIQHLTIGRCLMVVLTPIGVYAGGLYGAIIATIAQVVMTVLLVRSLASQALVKLPTASPGKTSDVSAPGFEVLS